MNTNWNENNKYRFEYAEENWADGSGDPVIRTANSGRFFILCSVKDKYNEYQISKKVYFDKQEDMNNAIEQAEETFNEINQGE
jgi:hypothetical protein